MAEASKAGGAERATARTSKSSSTDELGNTHSVDNADAQPGVHPTLETPGGETEARRKEGAERRAEGITSVRVEAELSEGVDPMTGEELSVETALRDGKTVMKPESKGDESDLIMPSHVQAPPVEQVTGGLTKANSSTRQRVEAARRAG